MLNRLKSSRRTGARSKVEQAFSVFKGIQPMKQIRYAVVGLGHIAQVAVLPAFKHARKNSRLTALVSGDKLKRESLGKKYRVSHLYSYEEYDDCLTSGEIDAVYIALPNDMHKE